MINNNHQHDTALKGFVYEGDRYPEHTSTGNGGVKSSALSNSHTEQNTLRFKRIGSYNCRETKTIINGECVAFAIIGFKRGKFKNNAAGRINYLTAEDILRECGV